MKHFGVKQQAKYPTATTLHWLLLYCSRLRCRCGLYSQTICKNIISYTPLPYKYPLRLVLARTLKFYSLVLIRFSDKHRICESCIFIRCQSKRTKLTAVYVVTSLKQTLLNCQLTSPVVKNLSRHAILSRDTSFRNLRKLHDPSYLFRAILFFAPIEFYENRETLTDRGTGESCEDITSCRPF